METVRGDGRIPKGGMGSPGKRAVGMAAVLAGFLFIVAVVLIRCSSALSDVPGRIGTGRPTPPGRVERGKRNLLKTWQKFQRFLGENDESLSRDMPSHPGSGLAA